MYKLSPNLEKRITNIIENEPTTDDFTIYTVMFNGTEMQMPGAEVHAIRKKNAEIVDVEVKALKEEIGDDPEKKMSVDDFNEWYKATVNPKLDDFEMLDHDFDSSAFGEAANDYYKETRAVRAQFKDEIIEHYGLRDSEDAELWIMEAGGEGIPTLDLPTVIKAFDSLANGIDPDPDEETKDQEGILEA